MRKVYGMRYYLYLILLAGSLVLNMPVTVASSIYVRPGNLHHFDLIVPETIYINKDFTVIVEAKDAWGNLVVDYSRRGRGVDVITNGRGQISPAEIKRWSFKDGRVKVYFKYDYVENFSITVREKEGQALGTSSIIQAKRRPDKPRRTSGEIKDKRSIYDETDKQFDHFLVVAPRQVKAGQVFDLIIEARDKNDHIVTDYHLRGTDVEIICIPENMAPPVVIKADRFKNGRAVIEFKCVTSGMISIIARQKRDNVAAFDEQKFYNSVQDKILVERLNRLERLIEQKKAKPLKGTPLGELPRLTEYTIGVRDVLDISVWQCDELTTEVTVGPDGRITFPLIGEVFVQGLTPAQLADKLRAGLAFYVKDPKVSVGVKKFGGKKVLIIGEVTKPGVYYLENQARLMEIISMAGGYTEDAVLKSTKVIRGRLKAENVISVDLTRLIKKGDMSQNIVICEGDIVYLPRMFIANVNYLFRQILPSLYFVDVGARTKIDIEAATR